MPPHISTRAGAALAKGEFEAFNRALRALTRLIGAVMPIDTTPTPISTFKARYSSMLKQADQDGVALISQGRKRYLIVSERHIASLANKERTMRTVADICMSLPRPRRADRLSDTGGDPGC